MSPAAANSPLPANPPGTPRGGAGEARKGVLWFLYGRRAEHERQQYIPVTGPRFQVGRKGSCALSLSCPSVSSVHAELIPSGETLWLHDQQSTNGTFVNGKRISGEIPVAAGDLVQFGRSVFRVVQEAPNLSSATAGHDLGDQAMSLVLFDRLFTAGAIIPHYHDIVDCATRKTLAWEVLVRSRLPGLEMPYGMFSAAEKLNLEVPFSQLIRVVAVNETRQCSDPPHLFLNTHPKELEGSELVESVARLREIRPKQRLTIEIHEAAVGDQRQVRDMIESLRKLDVSVAFDDFGAGQSRLVELADWRPEYLKFDISMTHTLRGNGTEKLRLVESLVVMAKRLGIATVAEGVETEEDLALCGRVGFDCVQGYLFGKPGVLDKRGLA